MEKYSAFRDPGTGIQPFLPPVPPQGSELFTAFLKPLLYLVGLVRTTVVILLALFYLVTVEGLCLLLPIPPLRRALANLLTILLTRLVLLLVGVYWISVETSRRKRNRSTVAEAWKPQAGDVIISNWISWVEVAWIAKFSPVFVLPVTERVEKAVSEESLRKATPGRKTGTGSAAISSGASTRMQPKRAEILGFVEVSFFRMIMACGFVPPYDGLVKSDSTVPMLSFEQLRARAKLRGRPIVLFPECTTSNGRGLLRFVDVLEGITLPVREFGIFIMCTRIDPPTVLAPTLSLPIPLSSPVFSIIRHIFTVASSLSPHALSIRLLAPSESPSSGTFLLSEFTAEQNGAGSLMSVCATLVADLGRLKKMGMGWEDKSLFLDFYGGKSKH